MRFGRSALAPDDLALVAREPALPGLAIVLDEPVFGRVLASALPEADIVAVRAEYVRYKPGTSCLVGYVAVDLAGRRTHVYARAHRPHDPVKLRSGHRAAEHETQLGAGGAVLDDHVVAVHVFPADRRLRTLARVVRDREVTTLRYKPERRWVGRIDDRVVRVYSAPAFAAAARGALALDAVRGLPVAPHVRVNERRHTVSARWVEGVPLDEQLGTPAGRDAAQAAGAALATLHRADVPGLVPAPAAHGALADAVGAVAAVVPALRHRALQAGARLARTVRDRGVSCPVHGDFSADQAVAGAEGVRLLDLDAAALGDPLEDLASFAAELELRVACGTLTAGTAMVTVEALFEGYRAARGPVDEDDPALADATARALLLRAAEPFRLRTPGWGPAVERVVARVETIAAHPGAAARRRP